MHTYSAASSRTERIDASRPLHAQRSTTADGETSQLLPDTHQPHALVDGASEGSPIAPRGLRHPPRQLMRAWLLLLLDRQASYGYELRRQLEALDVATETGAMYRTLRKLEREGCAASSWGASVAGPRRRLYELTTQGRRELTALVGAIAATRDVHAAFLRAHENAPPSAERLRSKP